MIDYLKLVRVSFFIACVSGLPPTTVAETARRRTLIIGVVADQTEFENGGCELLLASDTFKSKRYVFMSDFDGHAVMNINGHDIPLTIVRSTETNKEPKIGDRSKYWYTLGSLIIEVDYTVTGVCRPDDESCEVFYCHATIFVGSASARRSIKTHGLCGV